jgi:hypothetical protein
MVMFTMLSALTGCAPADAAAPTFAAGAFPHEKLTTVLAKYVDDKGLVDFKGVQQDRGGLDEYVDLVSRYSPAKQADLFPTRQDQEAYYLNAYNALAIKGVIDRPGLKSVQDSLVSFFVLTRYKLGGKKVSLKVLEDRLVREGFKDPRVHFALNCMSAGCPRFRAAAYTPAGLEAELDEGAKEFCTNPAKVNVDGDGKTAHISQIFEWFEGDFAAAGGRVAFINAHGGAIPADARVEIIPYDWALAAQPGRGP